MPKSFTGKPFIVITIGGGLFLSAHVVGGDRMDRIVIDYDVEGGDNFEHIQQGNTIGDDYIEAYIDVDCTSPHLDEDVQRFVVEQIRKWRATET